MSTRTPTAIRLQEESSIGAAPLGPALYGRYLLADFIFQRLWSLGLHIDPVTGEASVTDIQEHTNTLGATGNWSSFGVDSAGEL